MKFPVTELEAMDRAALSTVWNQVFATPIPKRLSSAFLRRFIAFEMQSRERGGLPKGFGTKLAKATHKDPGRHSYILKPGGRLIREWNGITHVVDVVDSGFLWNGQRFRSLSPIARAITGTRWSGPRFFGLRRVP